MIGTYSCLNINNHNTDRCSTTINKMKISQYYQYDIDIQYTALI